MPVQKANMGDIVEANPFTVLVQIAFLKAFRFFSKSAKIYWMNIPVTWPRKIIGF